MKVTELNKGTPQNPIMTRRFRVYPGDTTPGVINPYIQVFPGVGIEEIVTDAPFELAVAPDGSSVLSIYGQFAGGPPIPGGVLVPKYGLGEPFVEFTLVGDLSRTYDGFVKGTALPDSKVKLGTLVFGNHTIAQAA